MKLEHSIIIMDNKPAVVLARMGSLTIMHPDPFVDSGAV